MNVESSKSQEHIPDDQERMRSRIESAKQMLDEFVGIKPEERVLFLIDESKKNTDSELIRLLKESLKEKNISFEELIANDELTTIELLEKLENIDILWDSWDSESDNVDFEELTEFLGETGKRMVWSPGVRADSLDDGGALTESLETMTNRLEKMEHHLKDTVGLSIKSTYGTKLTMGLKRGERRWFKDTGVITPGSWDNLPGGEIFTTPDEESVNGVLVLPVLQDDITKEQGVDELVHLTIRNGMIAKIDGGKSAETLRKKLEEWSVDENDPKSVLRCAEIAFGANSKARSAVLHPEGTYEDDMTPTVEAEKRLGTMHIAFGASKHGEEGTEGYTEGEVHVDYVIPRNGLSVTAYKDDESFKKKKNGERLIDEGRWNFLS